HALTVHGPLTPPQFRSDPPAAIRWPLQGDLLDLVAQLQVVIGRRRIGSLPVPTRAAHLAQFAHPLDTQARPCLLFFFDVLVEAAPVLTARSRRCSST